MLTDIQIAQIMQHSSLRRRAQCLGPLNDAMVAHQIDANLQRAAAFVAQLGHESGELQFLEELWGPTTAQQRYEPLSDLARKLGNTQPGDGWRFRGLGLNQMTGRAAHENAAKEIGCSLDDLCQPLNCIHMALIEWDQKDCNDWADRDDAVSIRKLINGGNLKVSVSRINGLPEALAAVKRAKAVITPSDFETAPDRNSVASGSAPQSMAHSTEGQAAVTTGGGGAYSFYEGTQSAVQKAAAAGDLSAYTILTRMLAEPLVWLGAMTIATAVYWFLKRRARLYLDGV